MQTRTQRVAGCEMEDYTHRSRHGQYLWLRGEKEEEEEKICKRENDYFFFFVPRWRRFSLCKNYTPTYKPLVFFFLVSEQVLIEAALMQSITREGAVS